LIAVVVGAVIATHWPVLSAQALSLDDDQFFADNPLVTHPSWASVGRFFSEVLQPSTVSGYNNYLPMTMTSLMVDYAVGGHTADLRAYHRTNLALHAANTALIILLLYVLFGQAVPAALVGLLFGVHPLSVEPVAWVAERKGLLAAFFALCSLMAYMHFTRAGSRKWLWASLVIFILAVLSKPTAIVLPAMMLLLDFWPLGRLRLASLKEKIPLFAVAAVFVVITLLSRGRTTENIAQESRIRSASLEIPCYIFVFYFRKLFWPANLCSVYLLPRDMAISNPPVALSIVGVLLIAALALISLRWTRAVLAGVVFLLIGIAPTLGVVRYSWVTHHDKYVYLPAVGLLMILAWGIGKVWDSAMGRRAWRKASVVALALLVSTGEIAGVRAYLPHWSDSLALYEHMARVAPEAPVVHNNLGHVYFDLGRREEAIHQFHIALDQLPDDVNALYNLGVAVAQKGELKEAIQLFQKAEQLSPNDAAVQYNFGFALYSGGRIDDAMPRLRRAIDLKPDHAKAHQTLGLALAESDHPAEAAAHLLEAARLRPESPDILNTAAWVLATHSDSTVRRPGEAIRLALHAVDLTQHHDAGALDTLAAAYASEGQFGLALETAQAALALCDTTRTPSLAREIQERIHLYQQAKPYREPAPPRPSPR